MILWIVQKIFDVCMRRCFKKFVEKGYKNYVKSFKPMHQKVLISLRDYTCKFKSVDSGRINSFTKQRKKWAGNLTTVAVNVYKWIGRVASGKNLRKNFNRPSINETASIVSKIQKWTHLGKIMDCTCRPNNFVQTSFNMLPNLNTAYLDS